MIDSMGATVSRLFQEVLGHLLGKLEFQDSWHANITRKLSMETTEHNEVVKDWFICNFFHFYKAIPYFLIILSRITGNVCKWILEEEGPI